MTYSELATWKMLGHVLVLIIYAHKQNRTFSFLIYYPCETENKFMNCSKYSTKTQHSRTAKLANFDFMLQQKPT